MTKPKIRIEWLYDECDCETCGTTYADGARVFVNHDLLFEWLPYAHCYDGVSYEQGAVFREIVARLGYEFEQSYVDE